MDGKVKPFKLGVVDGSLEENTFRFFNAAGVRITKKTDGSEEIRVSMDSDGEFSFIYPCGKISRTQPILDFLAGDIISLAVVGKDWISEREVKKGEREFEIHAELGYARKSVVPVDIVFIHRAGEPIVNGSTKVCAAEYPAIARKWLDENGYPEVKVVDSPGKTEAQVANRTVDYGVCVRESGSSIRNFKLEIASVIFTSPVCIITRVGLDKESVEYRYLKYLCWLLEGAVKAAGYRIIRANVSHDGLSSVLEKLPSMLAPTVKKLHGKKGNSIEVVVPQHLFHVTMHLLFSFGKYVSDVVTDAPITVCPGSPSW
jgi:ATP phosphoribosyltransferase